jgi:hypothetical protein
VLPHAAGEVLGLGATATLLVAGAVVGMIHGAMLVRLIRSYTETRRVVPQEASG